MTPEVVYDHVGKCHKLALRYFIQINLIYFAWPPSGNVVLSDKFYKETWKSSKLLNLEDFQVSYKIWKYFKGDWAAKFQKRQRNLCWCSSWIACNKIKVSWTHVNRFPPRLAKTAPPWLSNAKQGSVSNTLELKRKG